MTQAMNEMKKYFSIRELVSKRVWDKYSDAAWSFFDPRLCEVVVWLRKGLGIPLVTAGEAIDRGIDAKVKHKDTELELTNPDKNE